MSKREGRAPRDAAEPRSYAPASPGPIRDAEFAKRLLKAAEQAPLSPPIQRGLLTWTQQKLNEQFGESVSVETIRKWYRGEMKPRPEKLVLLARLFEVDQAWLALGIEPDVTPTQAKLRNAMAAGAVNVVAGLIQMAGGHPAFPAEDDARAEAARIDLYAIIKGAQYAFHVALAQPGADPDHVRLVTPSNYDQAFQMGVLLDSATSVTLFEIPAERIEAGRRLGSTIELSLPIAEIRRRRITDLSKRL